ncbi:hypothetical protein GCM10023114_19610 [Mycolicibacterium sediminis]|uniref:Uncharacterized protein n=2 Tax=Mycolicibacterium sediminis TaxID=1286180 RepID=A0A7I7QQM9_9MYCO|nr:hypothetical protein MSEDJ_26080 [Mycolicibacterium sediminis]
MTVAAIVLGVIVAAAGAVLLAGDRKGADPAIRWEGMAATGLMFAVVGGPFWIAQGVCTLLATLDGATWWLWAWWLVAPTAGMAVRRLLPW